jgi:hypothetical protein
VAISSSAENQRLHLVACQSDTTGAFATAESGVRRLTQAAIEKLSFGLRAAPSQIETANALVWWRADVSL